MLEIAKEDIVSRLRFDNPWWERGAAGKIAFENTPRRKYFTSFFNTISNLSIRRATVLMGPRRVGKTVMVYHCIRSLLDSGVSESDILYISLETPIYTGLSLEKILKFYQELFGHSRDSQLFVFF